MGEQMIVLGSQLDENGRKWEVGVPLKDLTTHGFMVGTTGSGKSTALRNLALQTFDLGASTAILEPHGDLCLDVLDGVPNSMLDRVVYLALDSVQIPSIPLMTLGLAGGIDMAAGSAMSVMRMAEPASWDQSTRMREVLRHTSRVVLDALGYQASVLAVDRFLSSAETEYRQRILARVSEENAKSRDFCSEEVAGTLDDEKKRGGMKDSILGAQRRLEVFVTDRRLRRSMALPPLGPTISLAELLSGGRLVLLPVNQAEMGEKAAGLVSMLFMQMAKAAFLGRTDKLDRHQAVVMIDEFAAMAGAESGGSEVAEVTNTLLAEARKFGASILLATQSAEQLGPEVRKKVAINTNLKLILLVSDPDEARQAAGILGSDLINETDIRNIPRYHGYVRAMVHKSPKPPCLVQMLPPMNLAEKMIFFDEPESPQVSDLWQRVRVLAKSAVHPNAPASSVEVVGFLRKLDEPDWEQAVKDAMAWNRYHANRLLAYPDLEPDKVVRAKKISRMSYGLPWWMREAHYWRELEKGKKSVGRPPTQGIPASVAEERTTVKAGVQ